MMVDAKVLFKDTWATHAHGNDDEAEKLFREVLEVDPVSIEALYGLGIVLKAMGQHRRAIELFEEVVRSNDQRKWEDPVRIRMLRRLSLGQVNYLQNQDWNLEREVWHR